MSTKQVSGLDGTSEGISWRHLGGIEFPVGSMDV